MSTAIAAMIQVMSEVRTLAKDQRNRQQNFNFRGIDDVMNVVGPALRNHGVIVSPVVLDQSFDTVEIGSNKTKGGHVSVHMRYDFYTEDGSRFSAEGVGEAFDVGDKAASKALSMAYKYALIQALCLPTDEPDPDSSVYQRAAGSEPAQAPPAAAQEQKADPRQEWLNTLQDWASHNAVSTADLAARFAQVNDGIHITQATEEQLRSFYVSLPATEVADGQ